MEVEPVTHGIVDHVLFGALYQRVPLYEKIFGKILVNLDKIWRLLPHVEVINIFVMEVAGLPILNYKCQT